ncbi:hypothetical protein METH109765_07430 [Mesobacillus thioparans]
METGDNSCLVSKTKETEEPSPCLGGVFDA